MFKHTLGNAVRVSAIGAIGLGLASVSFSASAANGVQFNPDPLSVKVSESGVKAYYSIALTEKPMMDVSITFGSTDGQLTAFRNGSNEAMVRFTADNYSEPQVVVVSAVNDKTPEGTRSSSIGYQAVSADPGYNNMGIPPTSVTIIDDDKADVLLNQSDSATRVKEGGIQDSYTVRLGSQPTADVRITVKTDAATSNLPLQVTLSPSSLTFTPSNYSQPQTVTITAVDDANAETPEEKSSKEHLWHQVSSADAAYNLFPVNGDGLDFEVTIDDNDIELAGVEVRISDDYTRVTEGGAGDAYALVLKTQPATQVTVSIGAPGSDVTVSPASVTFTADNYNKAQSVTVSAVDDTTAEGPEAVTLTHAVSSSDLAYQGKSVDSVHVSIRDNDVHAVLVSESGGSSKVTEGGAQDSYSLALTKRPTADVTVHVESGGQLRAEPEWLTFTAANFGTPRSITLTAVDDLVVEESLKETVSHTATSEDFGYAGIGVDEVIVTIADNDSRGVLLRESGGSTRVTEGAVEGDRYTIALSAQPTGEVTVSVQADSQLSASPVSVTFTPDNFTQPQEITLTAVNDEVAQGARFAPVQHLVNSGDEGYQGIGMAALNVGIDDDDVPGLLLEESDGSTQVAEGGDADGYTLRLATRPTGDVVVHVNSGSQLQVSAATLTFTPADYDVPQTVEVSAVDDAEVQGGRIETVTHQVESTDPAYASGLALPELSVGVEDNDTSQIAKARSAGGSVDVMTLVVLVFAGMAGLCRLARRWNLG